MYLSYNGNYRTYSTSYAQPASVSYIYNPPTTVMRYQPSRVYYPGAPAVTAYTTRTYTTTTAPAYRYNNYRPSTYNTYYRRPVVQQTTTTVRPTYTGGSTVRTT